MTKTQKLSWIMVQGHAIAKRSRNQFDSYKQALSVGLRKAWRMAKGLLVPAIQEKPKVIVRDRQDAWVQEKLGNINPLEVELRDYQLGMDKEKIPQSA